MVVKDFEKAVYRVTIIRKTIVVTRTYQQTSAIKRKEIRSYSFDFLRKTPFQKKFTHFPLHGLKAIDFLLLMPLVLCSKPYFSSCFSTFSFQLKKNSRGEQILDVSSLNRHAPITKTTN
jgi:hypothetical protein